MDDRTSGQRPFHAGDVYGEGWKAICRDCRLRRHGYRWRPADFGFARRLPVAELNDFTQEMVEVRMKTVFAIFAALLALCPAVLAQTVASQISGTVHDPSGAVLPGVDVKVTNTDTTATRTTVTNEAGAYVFPNLPIGPYRLEASLPGFTTHVQSGIVLQVNSNPTINIELQVGQVSQVLEVQADASMVETHSNVIGQVIDQ